MKNPLNRRKKPEMEIDGDFSLSLILDITEYKAKNSKSTRTSKDNNPTKTSTQRYK